MGAVEADSWRVLGLYMHVTCQMNCLFGLPHQHQLLLRSQLPVYFPINTLKERIHHRDDAILILIT